MVVTAMYTTFFDFKSLYWEGNKRIVRLIINNLNEAKWCDVVL